MPVPHEDDAVLLCMPIGMGRVAAGSVKRQCDICGQFIAASRASMEAVIAAANEENVKWWLVCLSCAPDILPKDSKMLPITDAQKAEILEELRRREVEGD